MIISSVLGSIFLFIGFLYWIKLMNIEDEIEVPEKILDTNNVLDYELVIKTNIESILGKKLEVVDIDERFLDILKKQYSIYYLYQSVINAICGIILITTASWLVLLIVIAGIVGAIFLKYKFYEFVRDLISKDKKMI